MTENSAELTAHFTTGAVAVYGIEWAKKSGLVPWLTADTKTLNRITSAVLAAVAVMGINWNYDPTIGRLVVDGLTWSAIALSCWELVKQFVLQQVIFDSVIPKGRE